MKTLLLSLFLSCFSSHLSAEANLQAEAIALLKTAIAESKGVPESMTPEKLFQVIAGEVDFGVSEADESRLKERKPLRDSKEFSQVAEKAASLDAQKFPVSDDAITKAVTDSSTDERTREAAFRLLSHFNKMKVKSLTTLNITRAKQLCTAAIVGGDPMKEISGIEGYQKLRFQHLTAEEDWLYSPDGFGNTGDAAPHGGKVILMAPRTIDGQLVVGCDNGSVYALPLDKVRDRIDVSKLKAEGAE
jgi:hypothetical protein